MFALLYLPFISRSNFVFPDGAAHTVTPSPSFDQPCIAGSSSGFPSLQSPQGGGTVGYTVANSDTQWVGTPLFETLALLVFDWRPLVS